MEKRLPVALRAVARFKSAKKGRRELFVACAQAFGETRRIKRTETRRFDTQYEALLRNIFIRLIGLISLIKWLVSAHTDLSLPLWPSAKHGGQRERRHGGVLGLL